MSSTEIAGLCNDLTQSDLNGLCNSRTALCQQVAASGNAAAIQAASTALCLRLSDLSVVAIYSINGQVDQLLRVLIAALRLRGTQVAMIVVVDGDHFKATVDTFSNLSSHEIGDATQDKVEFGSVIIVRGGPSISSKPLQPKEEEILHQAVERVVDVGALRNSCVRW